jgi:hypothetical protein
LEPTANILLNHIVVDAYNSALPCRDIGGTIVELPVQYTRVYGSRPVQARS